MDNPRSAVAVPLSTFGGLITELTPSDIPEGGSPDNQDIAFAPGGFQTRPGLARVYASPPTAAKVVFQKTFTRNDGSVFNVLMDANGAMWGENFSAAPGVFTNFANVPAGSYCKALEAYGRLFMCFNDGLRGTSIPLQWDGTNVDRVTQDGPGAGPSISNVSIPASTMAVTGAGSTITITSMETTDPVTTPGEFGGDVTIYYTITVTTATPHGVISGQTVAITGNSYSGFNKNWIVGTIVSPTIYKVNFRNYTYHIGTGGSTVPPSLTASRNNNVVSLTTTAAHGLEPGFQIIVSGVANNSIGGGISSVSRLSNITTVKTNSNHGLVPKSIVAITAVTDTTFNGPQVTVLSVVDDTHFTYANNGSDGTSSSGQVQDIWNGTFFVATTPTTTTLTYTQVGANDYATSAGTITPNGQITPGIHKCVVMFQTRQGFITPPSPPISFTANGGQYMVVSNLPIGPSNVVARVLAFTGADGSRYFSIPVPVLDPNGNVISDSTVVNDNTSTSILLDFSDDALLGAAGIDIAGNNLFNLRVLGRCSGVFLYADRTFWWGDDNKTINFVNMGFDGGYVGTLGSTLPLGWSGAGSTGGTGTLVNATHSEFGFAYRMTSAGGIADCMISQDAYRDAFSAAIAQPNTKYTFRCKVSSSAAAAGYLIADLYSPGLGGVVAGGSFPIASMTSAGSWISGTFGSATGSTIPSDLILRIYLQSVTAGTIVTVDESALIFATKPYNDAQFEVSYVLNPESVDGLTGVVGATADQTPIMDIGRLRDNLYWVTQATLQTTKNVTSEPATWEVNEMGTKCGACSMFGLVTGESWLAWPCLDGVRMWDGSNPVKITQDVQAKWDAITLPRQIVGLNDAAARRMYFAVAKGTDTEPKHLYVIDYRYAETGAEIEERGAIRISPYNGKMLVLELSRKFCEWSVPATSVGQLTTANGVETCFGDALGRVYSLNQAQFHDDDYGVIPWYYVTSPFVSDDMEQQLQVGSFRHLYTYVTAFYVSGAGTLTITPLAGTLTNAWPARGPYPLLTTPNASLELPLNVSAEKLFLKFSGSPLAGFLDSAVNFSRMVVAMKPHPFSPVRL